MASNNVRLDPDDLFDKVVFVENNLLQEGYNEGFNDGKIQGEVDGFLLGVKHGKENGKEIGFYQGFVSTWLLLLPNDIKDAPNKRAKKLLDQLNLLLEEYKCFNVEDEAMQDKVDTMRRKFKQLSSVLKVPTEFNKEEKIEYSF